MESQDSDATDSHIEQTTVDPVEAIDEAEAAGDPEVEGTRVEGTEATGEEVAASEAPEAVAIDLTEDATGDGPTVDALESQLRDLQGAMDQLQSGDLDAAERTIEALEQSVGGTRD